MNNKLKCPTCGKEAHDYEHEEFLDCVPPLEVLTFGPYHISREYRDALYEKYPFYTSEEVVGSYLGKNPYFPSEALWYEEQNEEDSFEEY